MSRGVVLSDADNTLWDTDALFSDAQLGLLDEVERALRIKAEVPHLDRLGWIRSCDQAIATIDHRHLRYPPEFLVKSIAMVLMGASASEAARFVVQGAAPPGLTPQNVAQMIEDYQGRLSQMPDLLPGVRAGLQEARLNELDVWILSEGSASRQRSRVFAHRLETLISGIVEATKNTEQFARQRRRFAPLDVYVIGDQPDRDIAPARTSGCRAVLVPSRFRPEWYDHKKCEADYVAGTFDKAIEWIVGDVTARGATA